VSERLEAVDVVLSDIRKNLEGWFAGEDASEDFLVNVVRQGCFAILTQRAVSNHDLMNLAQACIHLAVQMELAEREKRGQG
jgi:hypothetical protein